jgi:transcriptional regulator with XRE-family HTH domain
MAKKAGLIAISAFEIKQKRIQRGWSQEQAALYCGVSRGSWQHYERAGVTNAIVVAAIKRLLG